MSSLVSSAMALSVVIFALSVSVSKMFAKKHAYRLDPNQVGQIYFLKNIDSFFFFKFQACK